MWGQAMMWLFISCRVAAAKIMDYTPLTTSDG